MRKWIIRFLILIGYCVPYAFLSMNGDATTGTLKFYGVMLICLSLLCLFSIKTNNSYIVILGSLLSYLCSYLFMLEYATENWKWYFKPFPCSMFLIIISIVALLIQSPKLYQKFFGVFTILNN